MPGTAAAFDRSGFRIPALLLMALIAHAVGCARRFPETEVTPIQAINPAELERDLLNRKPDTASPFGLAVTGSLDYAWNSFEKALKNDNFFNARRK